METLLRTADRWHASVTGHLVVRRFAVVVRVLLAVGFAIPGAIKVLGLPFTKESAASGPVGLFFDVLERSGALYEFVGVAQVAAAVLLLVPRTRTVGALIYLPVISGIVVLTTTMDFAGTWVITSLMLLGVVFLLCADWPRLRPLFGTAPRERAA
ncbi:hypothetical protein [Amycolatopsis sp. CA-230715]|uniref:hypothetical protein n=1 Tax=Amycolatopsis sp. CA-230715 TaxID=2745196 RepID=UPI001C0282A4|nr:hypothetical protein [Amycolatopsis sp. CA-230715]QWF83360.1 hypothetical protein HUW46_06800 [Amycolatopsis sp. CA-230715]